MGEAAEVQAPAPEPAKADNDTRPAVKPEPRADIRDKLVEDLKKQSRKREREEAKAKEPAKPAAPAPAKDPKAEPKPPAKEPAKREAAAPKEDPKAPATKDAPKAKDGKPDAKPANEEQPADGDDDRQKLQHDRRNFAKYQRKTERKYEEREAQVAGREQIVEVRERRILEDIKRDPLKALRELGVDVRKTLLEYVDEENEDPRDRSLRELREKAENAEKTAKQLADERAQEKSRGSFEKVGRVLRDAWDGFEPDDHPYLRAIYEPDELVGIARKVVLSHYAKTSRRDKEGNIIPGTGQQLAPARVFAYLEEVEREDDERKQAARSRRQTIGAKTAPESREQVPPVESASPERRPRASDVTNRATRIGASNGSSEPLRGEALKERLRAMAREAMNR